MKKALLALVPALFVVLTASADIAPAAPSSGEPVPLAESQPIPAADPVLLALLAPAAEAKTLPPPYFCSPNPCASCFNERKCCIQHQCPPFDDECIDACHDRYRECVMQCPNYP